MLKKLAPLGSLDRSPLGSLDKPSLGSIDKQSVDRSSADSHSGSSGRPIEFNPKRLNKPILGNIDQKVLGSLDKSSLSSIEKSPLGSPLRKPRARDFIKENTESKETEHDLVKQIGDPKVLLSSPAHSQSSSTVSVPPRNSLTFGSNRSFLKTSTAVYSEDEEEVSKSSVNKDEHFESRDKANAHLDERASESPVRGILKSSPAKSNTSKDTETQHTKTLRQAMLQRDEKRIMFDLDKNIEFTSEVGFKLVPTFLYILLQTEECSESSEKSSVHEDITDVVNESFEPTDKNIERYTPIFEPKVSKIYPDESSGSDELSNSHYKGSYFCPLLILPKFFV